MNSPDLSLPSPPSLAELRARAYAAVNVREAVAEAAGRGPSMAPLEISDPLARAILNAAKAAAKVEIDRYLAALAEAKRKGPRPEVRKRKAAAPAQLPEGKAPARKPRKAKPLDA